jgi:hypothetical protein
MAQLLILVLCLFVSLLFILPSKYTYSSMAYRSVFSGKVYTSPLFGENQRKKGEPSYEKQL